MARLGAGMRGGRRRGLCVTLPKSQKEVLIGCPGVPGPSCGQGRAEAAGSQSDFWNVVLLSCLFLSPPLDPLDCTLCEDKGQVGACSPLCARRMLVR